MTINSDYELNINSTTDTVKSAKNRQSNQISINANTKPVKTTAYPNSKNTCRPIIIKNKDL